MFEELANVVELLDLSDALDAGDHEIIEARDELVRIITTYKESL